MNEIRKKEPHDLSRINLSEQWEIDYWTESLKVNETQLMKAISEIGHFTDTVKKYLELQKH